MHTLTLTAIGNSTGVILPKEILARLKTQKGGKLCLTETPNGYEISAHDADFEKEMQAAGDVMKQYRNALRELAK
jgi:putative addiction module antidote